MPRQPMPFEIVLPVRGLTTAFSAGVIALLAAHALLSYLHFRVEELPWLLRQLFDLDEENNLPSWFSQFLHLSNAALLAILASARLRAGDRHAHYWTALAVGFFLMAIDEVAGVHETVNSIIEVTWAIPALIGVGLVGPLFLPFLWSLPRSTALGFAAAGGIFVGGALVVEIFGNEMMENDLGNTFGYSMATLLEEGMEMTGLVVFAHFLLRHLRAVSTQPPAGSVRIV